MVSVQSLINEGYKLQTAYIDTPMNNYPQMKKLKEKITNYLFKITLDRLKSGYLQTIFAELQRYEKDLVNKLSSHDKSQFKFRFEQLNANYKKLQNTSNKNTQSYYNSLKALAKRMDLYHNDVSKSTNFYFHHYTSLGDKNAVSKAYINQEMFNQHQRIIKNMKRVKEELNSPALSKHKKFGFLGF